MIREIKFDSIQDFTLQPIVDMGLQYINGLNIIKKQRKRGKKIIAGFLPPMELGFCSEYTLPFFLPRVVEFPFQGLINAITAANKFFPFSRVLKFWSRIQDASFLPRSKESVVTSQDFSRTFAGMAHVANDQYYRDSCVQVRICYGAYVNYQRYFDLLTGGFDTHYCLYFAKSHERMASTPLFYFQMPIGSPNTPHALDLTTRELERYFQTIERLTGVGIDFAGVKARMKKVNELKAIAALIFHKYFKKGYVPFHWTASLLLHAAYTDYLSDLDFFHERMHRLLAIIDKKIRDGTFSNYEREGIPRVLVVGGPGFDPAVAQMFEKARVCFLYLDVFPNELQYELLDLSGDFIVKYAHYLLGKMNYKRGVEDLHDFWLEQARLLRVDGIVFTDVWGCRHIAPSFRLFKDRAHAELGIPVLQIHFKDLGEHLGQLTTRIEAFLDLIIDPKRNSS